MRAVPSMRQSAHIQGRSQAASEAPLWPKTIRMRLLWQDFCYESGYDSAYTRTYGREALPL